MAKLPLIWLRQKRSSKPENGLNWSKAPHEINGISLRFSNFHTCPSHLEGFLEHRLPTPRVDDLAGLWWVPKSCIYKKFPGDAEAAGPGTTL